MPVVSTVMPFPLPWLSAGAFAILIWTAMEGWIRAGREWGDRSWIFGGPIVIAVIRTILGIIVVRGLLTTAIWIGLIPLDWSYQISGARRMTLDIALLIAATVGSIGLQVTGTIIGFSIGRKFKK